MGGIARNSIGNEATRTGEASLALVVLGLVVTSLFFSVGCRTARRHGARACAGDSDCSSAQVCRDAVCRKSCQGGLWVGQDVTVERSDGVRKGVVSDCDRTIWVRYESGVDEGVGIERVKPVRPKQGGERSKQ